MSERPDGDDAEAPAYSAKANRSASEDTLLQLKKMRAFHAIAETGSFVGAGRKLRMAQPWISSQLRQVEESLGMRLIERSKGQCHRLTQNGEALFTIVEKVLEACADATRQIDRINGRRRQSLILGLDPITIHISERNRLIVGFIDRAQDIDLQIVSGTPAELFERLERGELDLILTSSPRPLIACQHLPLFSSGLHMVVPKRKTRAPGSDAAVFHESTPILTLPDKYHPELCAKLRQSFGSKATRWIECPEAGFEALIRYAAIKRLATIVPDFLLEDAIIQKQMDLREIDVAAIRIGWGLFRRPERASRPAEYLWRAATLCTKYLWLVEPVNAAQGAAQVF